MVIILSTGRAGTNYLYNILSQNDKSLIVTHQTKSSRFLNILANFCFTYPFFSPLCIMYYRLSSKKEFKENVVILDPLKSVYYAILIQKGIIKNVKLIHLIRDPRTFTESFMNWKSSSKNRFILHHIVPFWQPNPWLFRKVNFVEWIKMAKFLHFAWIWKIKHDLFKACLKTDDLTVKFENITFSDTREKSILEILTFINPEKINDNSNYILEKINESRSKNFKNWANWDKSEISDFKKVCNDVMFELGYGTEELWSK